MGIALLALTGLLKKLPTFDGLRATSVKRPSARPHPAWAARPASCAALPGADQGKNLRNAPRLRVLCVHESDQGPTSAGRMVISGRMADVCAELDRLAAQEASHTTP